MIESFDLGNNAEDHTLCGSNSVKYKDNGLVAASNRQTLIMKPTSLRKSIFYNSFSTNRVFLFFVSSCAVSKEKNCAHHTCTFLIIRLAFLNCFVYLSLERFVFTKVTQFSLFSHSEQFFPPR